MVKSNFQDFEATYGRFVEELWVEFYPTHSQAHRLEDVVELGSRTSTTRRKANKPSA